VAVGDFYQLPPVYKTTDIRFVFESPLWSKIITKTCTLTENMRQHDPVFQKILNEARVGELTEESVKLLQERKGLPWKKLQIRPTLLFSRKYDVDHVNMTNLKRLVGPFHRFIAKTVFLPIASVKGFKDDSPEIQASIKKIDKDATYSTELLLAIGAQVILLYNMDQEAGLVNGSRGVVIGFVEKDGVELPKVKFLQGSEIVIEHHTWECEGFEGVMRRQIPLTLGYAITIHKAQGATLDSALIDIGPTTFECGQAYVALSRAKSLESLYIWELDITAFKVHPRVRKFYEQSTVLSNIKYTPSPKGAGSIDDILDKDGIALPANMLNNTPKGGVLNISGRGTETVLCQPLEYSNFRAQSALIPHSVYQEQETQ